MKRTTSLLYLISVCSTLAACHNASPGQDDSDALPSTFALKCSGPESVVIERQGMTQPMQSSAQATIFYTWNGDTNSLVTEHAGSEATSFCHDDGQEECSASVYNTRLTGKSFDLRRGVQPDAVTSFGEQVDIDLSTMTGTATMISSAGTLTNDAANVAMKTTVTINLKCERRG